ADRAADTSLDAQHVVTVRIHPDASLRRDRSRPVETVLVPLLVFDELGIALTFDRYEIDADGWPVGFLPDSRQLELVLGTMSREKKIERLGRERIRVGAAIAILPVFLARDATVDFSHFAHDRRVAGSVTAFCFEVQLRFDASRESLGRITRIDRLHPG